MKGAKLVVVAVGFSFGISAPAPAQSPRLDTAQIEALTGLKGTWNEAEGVFKVTSPRGDVKVAVDGWSLPPFMGLTSWASFMPAGAGKVMVMGDLVLFQDEVNPVMSAALDSGLEVTALHNHFFFDEPRVYFMHVGGEGTLAAVAQGVRRALDAVQQVRSKVALPADGFGGPPLPATSAVTAKAVDDVLGTRGQANAGMYKVVIGRAATHGEGHAMGKEMGVNTWAAFAGTDENAVVDGDFAMREGELQGVLRALRKADINVVAIHHHMAGESPRFLFLHYWGRGRVEVLARGLKAALDTQK